MLVSSTWQSVLATMKSTPSIPPSIIVLTEFPPPPPTPMTLMLGRPGLAPSSSNSSMWDSSNYRSHASQHDANFLPMISFPDRRNRGGVLPTSPESAHELA